MTNYYIDLTNGTDAHTGLKNANSTITTGVSTTIFIDTTLSGADNYNVGDYVWDITAGHGALITAYVSATHTVTIGSAITGLATSDSYYIIAAWKTVEKFTANARTAGDIAYIRAGGTETVGAADITFTTAGNQAATISLIGCDASVNDPWYDASNTVPIVDFNTGAFQMVMSKAFWVLNRLTIKNSTKTGSGILNITGNGVKITYCNITNSNGAAAYGIFGSLGGLACFIDHCVLNNNKTSNIFFNLAAIVNIDGCTLDGTTITGITVQGGGDVYVSNSTFGSNTAHTTNDIMTQQGSRVYCRNCTFNKTTLGMTNFNDELHSEDDGGTFGNQTSYYLQGTVTKSATARSGGATSSVQMLPSTNCGLIFPLTISNMSPQSPDFAIYNTSTGTVNVDIYIRGLATWVTYPTASQLYTQASYLTSASTAARATVVSTAVIADGTTWVAFRTTMVPARAGWIYIKVFLNYYVSTKGVLVDIKPVIS